MKLLHGHRLLLLLVTLLLAVGHAHQAFGRFQSHHHGIEMRAGGGLEEHGSGTHHDNDEHGNRQKDAEHLLAAHAVIAIMPALMAPPIVVIRAVGLARVTAAQMPEAPVVGIDHPPQLRG